MQYWWLDDDDAIAFHVFFRQRVWTNAANFFTTKPCAKKALIELQGNNAKPVLASIFKNLVDVDPTQSGRF